MCQMYLESVSRRCRHFSRRSTSPAITLPMPARPGYDRETVNLTEAIPQSERRQPPSAPASSSPGSAAPISQAAANQLNTSQSSLGQLNALQNYSTPDRQSVRHHGRRIEHVAAELLQRFFRTWRTIRPRRHRGRRCSVRRRAVASSFQNASGELNSLNTDVNSRITADVTQINSIASRQSRR